eukprot:TRINITY_DN66376_c13_g3_i1.p1 TRINITY_DN66376_c13_g3~~TRINITY_DN66376_c13_g3_i1.p1  ORF type:complete len:968 (+),score=547.08 TRINITY_DN66376_c13_g3_i1:137-2905(+)
MGNKTDNFLFSSEIILRLQALQARLEAVQATVDDPRASSGNRSMNVTWQDLCYKPIPGKSCVRQSVTQYFLGDPPLTVTPTTPTRTISDRVQHCGTDETATDCRGDIGAPTFPYVVLGGYPEDVSLPWNLSTVLIVTYPLNNVPENETMYEAWEKEWLRVVEAGEPGLKLDYSAQRSVQDELARSTETDIPTVAISYFAMFLYISLALGRLWPVRGALVIVRTKFLLGLGAILIVIMSLVISVGLCSALGVQVSPIISEVIPFLVLAIGIDNVFIILGTFHAMDPRQPIEERLGNTLGRVGLSITLASISEAVAFFLGALTRMPAVESFAFFSAVAIFADYCLQLTCFSAFLVLDARRHARNGIDCLPCLSVRRSTVEQDRFIDYVACTSEHPDGIDPLGPAAEDLQQRLVSSVSEQHRDMNSSGTKMLVLRDGLLKRFVRNVYVPVLFHRVTKMVVVLVGVFAVLFSLGYMSHNLKLGLEQQTALPRDSYLQAYFEDIATVFRVGPPVYFVVRPNANSDFSLAENQNRVCTVSGCPENTLGSILDRASEDYANTFMAERAGVTSWLDDYIDFLLFGNCCRYNPKTGDLCNPELPESPDCVHCVERGNPNDYQMNMSRPSAAKYHEFLSRFMTQSQCNWACPACGWGHVNATKLNANGTDVIASNFMDYHKTLKTQEDFIDALVSARRIADKISEEQQLDVFPYSVFYVYFEQYLYIKGVAVMTAGLALLGILVLSLILMRNAFASLQVLVCIVMILCDLLGIMAMWDVRLNALSTVNFVMAIGISVEFCIHVAVAFLRARGDHDSRAASAVINVGSSVITGIFFTKFIGVIVLYFSPSAIFRIYYFRMYLSMVLLGAFHGLMFLPVMLSLVGPDEVKKSSKSVDGNGDDDDHIVDPYLASNGNGSHSQYRTLDDDQDRGIY